ncbi:MAG TPA: membrane protein insertase YidC [Kiritimatiellia bacterium]|nr:membrane protein insertase YidC [Kiritimatiellia bacterium]
MAMNKKDMLPFVALLALLFAWPVIDRKIAEHFFPDRIAPVRPASAPPATPDAGISESDAPPALAPVAEKPAAPAPAAAAIAEEAPVAEPAQLFTLANERAEFVFTSRGAGLGAVTLNDYRRSIAKDSGPMTLDFMARPSLAWEQLPGLSDDFNFAGAVSADNRSVTFTRTTAAGLRFERTLEVDDSYVIRVTDRFVNTTDAPIDIPAALLRTGPMSREPGHKDSAGVVSIGVDSLSPGGEKVQHWGGKIAKRFTAEMEERELPALPRIHHAPPRDNPVDWVSAKNKYFVQILTPEGGGERLWIYARRAPAPRELADPAFAPRKMTDLEEVGAAVEFLSQRIEPGQAIERASTLYAGPMKFSELHAMRLHQVDVMEFGMWAPIGKLLLRVLNFLHAHIPPYNYGIAIILLTLIVRIIFWPVTHKSTESMKRMAAVAPLVTELRAKYKDNPQKQQQEIMALYKEHKVNPLGGCLPMLIQIPVFIALFVVLRSAIELRFASFLWIADLSEAENLLPGLLPFGLPLNILPLLMAGTMYLQMKLSPSAGDPAQQKIMAIMMPGMMLVFLYNFASGLALYWTTQNVLMIVQQMMMKKNVTPLPVPAKPAGKK